MMDDLTTIKNEFIKSIQNPDIWPVQGPEGIDQPAPIGPGNIVEKYGADKVKNAVKGNSTLEILVNTAQGYDFGSGKIQTPLGELFARDADILFTELAKQNIGDVTQLKLPGVTQAAQVTSGRGVFGLSLVPDETGKPVSVKSDLLYKKPSTFQQALPFLAVAALPFLGPLIGAAGAGAAGLGNAATAAGVLGGSTAAAGSGLAGMLSSAGLSATAANALASGLVHGTFRGGIADLAGGKFGKGFASGFVGGAAPVVAGPVTQTLTQAGLSPELAKITTSGGIGGLSAAAGGRNIGQGVLGSALNTGIGIGMDKAGITKLPAPVRGVVTEGISSAIRGKPFDLASAAQNAALNYGLNQTIGPQGMKAVNTFLAYKNMVDSLGRVKASPSNAITAFNAYKAQRR